MVWNFIAVVLCIMAAIVQGYRGNIYWVALEIGLAIANLPFAIKWLMTIF